MERDARRFFENIHKDRLKALKRLIKLRPVVAALMEEAGIDSSPLFEIELLIAWSDREQAAARGKVFDRCYVACARMLTILESERPARARTGPPLLTDLRKQIWECLSGRALLSKEVRRHIPLLPSNAAVRKHVEAIRATGREIEFTPGLGYTRPDAPPPITLMPGPPGPGSPV